MTERWLYKPVAKWSHGYLTSDCPAHTARGSWVGLDWAGNGMSSGYHILAAWHGTVGFSGWVDWGFGYCVRIDHDNGLQTWYAHFRKASHLKVGDKVMCGDFVGEMGSTGYSTGPHLHFALKQRNTALNKGWLCPASHLVQGTAAGEYKMAEPNYYFYDLSLLQAIPNLMIDISQNQDGLDWDRLMAKVPNLKGVIIRASDGANTDPSYLSNWQKARDRKLIVGAYHALRPSTPISSQITTFVNAVRYNEVDLPLAIDFELANASSDKNQNRLNVRNMALGIAEKDNLIKYSAAYYVWKQLYFDYMTANFGPKGWNRDKDHLNKNWPMVYTSKESWKLMMTQDENWELLPLWTAQWDSSSTVLYGNWLTYANHFIRQVGHGKEADFGRVLDMNAVNPSVPFPTLDTPPPVEDLPVVRFPENITFTIDMGGRTLKGSVKLGDVTLEEV